jgi:zinc-binding alcohol dehydrogenase/oxidoreductase
MKKMKALLFQSKDAPLGLTDLEKPVPGQGEFLIQMHCAALNHLDLWIWQEQELSKPVISGSDGSGVVIEAGQGTDPSLIGKKVIINPGLYWGDNEKVPGEKFEVLGAPTNGTFAEYMVVPAEYVYEKPAYLTMAEAAALPMAALTAYRAAFTKAKITANDNVLITGIGGGVALCLLQMSVAAGAKVYVTSSVAFKINKAIALGAKGGFIYKNKDWVDEAKQEAGGFDVIIDSAGGNGFADLTAVAKAAARIVVLGRTAGEINHIKPGLIFNKQLELYGSLMGSSNEFKAMLDFITTHQLHPVIDKIFLFDKIHEAASYMDGGNHFGKVLLNINT